MFSIIKASQIGKRIEDLREILDGEEGNVCIPQWPGLPHEVSDIENKSNVVGEGDE